MTSSRNRTPRSPPAAGAHGLFGEQQRQHGGPLLALRAEQAQVAVVARLRRDGALAARHRARSGGARGAGAGAAASRRRRRTPPPRPATSTNSRSSRCGPNDDRPRPISRARRARSAATTACSSYAGLVELADQAQIVSPAARRQRGGRRGEGRRQTRDEVAAAAPQLDGRPCKLRVPRVERRPVAAVAHARELRVALAQRVLQLVVGRLVGRLARRRESIEMSPPARGAAFHEQQALGHEDEDWVSRAQLVDGADLDAVDPRALSLTGRVGHLERRVRAHRPSRTRATARAAWSLQPTSLSSRLVRGDTPRRA